MPNHLYQVYGLVVDSCIEFPELPAASASGDVCIIFGTVPENLPDPEFSDPYFQIKNGQYLILIESVGRMLVEDGARITVHPTGDLSEDLLRANLLGSGLGAILYQRGLVPLHASGVRMAAGCILFCGRRGFGKSTLAYEFVRRGYALHSDDVCVVQTRPDAVPLGYPGYPQLKMNPETLERLAAPVENLPRVAASIQKYALRLENFDPTPLPVQAVFFLKPYPGEVVQIEPVGGAAKFTMLKNHIFRRKFVIGVASHQNLFETLTGLAESTPIFRVRRPNRGFLLNELADAVLAQINDLSN